MNILLKYVSGHAKKTKIYCLGKYRIIIQGNEKEKETNRCYKLLEFPVDEQPGVLPELHEEADLEQLQAR